MSALLKLLQAIGPDKHVQLSFQDGVLAIAVPGARPSLDYVYTSAVDPHALGQLGTLNMQAWVDCALIDVVDHLTKGPDAIGRGIFRGQDEVDGVGWPKAAQLVSTPADGPSQFADFMQSQRSGRWEGSFLGRPGTPPPVLTSMTPVERKVFDQGCLTNKIPQYNPPGRSPEGDRQIELTCLRMRNEILEAAVAHAAAGGRISVIYDSIELLPAAERTSWEHRSNDELST
jgi:hypothetical protein